MPPPSSLLRAVGAALVAGAVVASCAGSARDESVGTVVEAEGTERASPTASAGAAADAATTADAAGEPTAEAADDREDVPAIATRSGRIGDQEIVEQIPPASIAIDAIAVAAPVVPVGIDPDGLMTVPDRVDQIGWYAFGSAPGEPGTAVLAGHVDDRVQGRGAFFGLRDLGLGDRLATTDAEGVTTTWEVTGREAFEKESLPIEDLYRRDGDPRLVLITCGGDFDRAARSYESNVVVVAVAGRPGLMRPNVAS